MLQGIRARATYANVMSTLALFIALGGVSYAAVKLPARSVGNAQLRDRAVSQRTLDSTLRTRLNRTGKQGIPGPAGADGSPGARGEQGPAGTIDGVEAGGDLEGRYPSPTLRQGIVRSSTVLDGSLGGADINEDLLGQVPLAAAAKSIDGIERDDLVTGSGRLLASMDRVASPYTPLSGSEVDLSPNFQAGTVMPMVTCANAHPSFGTGARLKLHNFGQGPANLWVDDGTEVHFFSIPAPGAASLPFFANDARRFTIAGIATAGPKSDEFVVDVFAQHEGTSCRAGFVGQDT